MKAFVRWLLVFLLAGAYLWPAAASAQSLNPSTASQMTAEQAQAAFASSGFETDPIVNWGWRGSETVRSFVVHDATSGRVVTVLVFPSSQDADLFRGGMVWHTESTTLEPYVLAGYGPSVWRGNIGMVESTDSELQHVTVDDDFLQALESRSADL